MKILNLYAGIGGNRKLWGEEHEITAVEINPEIAKIYQFFFPNDKIIITDAHKFLLEYYDEFDIIWSSPPCQTHSSFRYNIGVKYRGVKPVYPDMKLYQEIIFLQYHFKGKWVVENVKPYYKPLIEPTAQVGRHYIWSNVNIPSNLDLKSVKLRNAQIPQLQETLGFDLSKFKIKNKRQVLRNCVEPQVGKYILNYLLKETGG